MILVRIRDEVYARLLIFILDPLVVENGYNGVSGRAESSMVVTSRECRGSEVRRSNSDLDSVGSSEVSQIFFNHEIFFVH